MILGELCAGTMSADLGREGSFDVSARFVSDVRCRSVAERKIASALGGAGMLGISTEFSRMSTRGERNSGPALDGVRCSRSICLDGVVGAGAGAGAGLAGVVTTGATAVLRGAALFSGETGSLPLPVRGGTITSQAIAMVTAAPADEYTVVRFLPTASSKLAWTRALVDLQAPSATPPLGTSPLTTSPLATALLATSLLATSAGTTSRQIARDSRPVMLPDEPALSCGSGEMTIWEADHVCIEGGVHEAPPTAAVTVGGLARSLKRAARGRPRGLAIALPAAFAAAAAAVSAAPATCSSSSATRDC